MKEVRKTSNQGVIEVQLIVVVSSAQRYNLLGQFFHSELNRALHQRRVNLENAVEKVFCHHLSCSQYKKLGFSSYPMAICPLVRNPNSYIDYTVVRE